jgi:hypothetical protein
LSSSQLPSPRHPRSRLALVGTHTPTLLLLTLVAILFPLLVGLFLLLPVSQSALPIRPLTRKSHPFLSLIMAWADSSQLVSIADPAYNGQL